MSRLYWSAPVKLCLTAAIIALIVIFPKQSGRVSALVLELFWYSTLLVITGPIVGALAALSIVAGTI